MTNNEIKAVKALQQKKVRDSEAKFVVEGKKMLEELALADGIRIESVFLLEEDTRFPDAILISQKELERISSLKSPNTGLAVCLKLVNDSEELAGNFIVFENLQDPGNLGTVIRSADWFNVKQVILTPGSVDVYNPKVIQATMGACFRVKVAYMDIPEFLEKYTGTVYATSLKGENLYTQPLAKHEFAIVMGNESKGISDFVDEKVANKLFIPNYGDSSESLNVAIATAVVLAEFRRG